MPVTGGGIRLSSDLFQTVSAGVLTPYNVPAPIQHVINYANGTAAAQYDQLHCKLWSLTGSTQSIDLTSILLADGTTGNMARVREWFFLMLSTNPAHKLTLDMTVSNGYKPPGDATSGAKRTLFGAAAGVSGYNFDHWSDLYSVGAGVGGVVGSTSKIITLDPGANTFTVLAVIAGCSAVS